MIWIRGLAAAFGAAGITTKLIAAASVAVALITAYGIWHHHVWSNGYEDALAAIGKQDKKAIAKATEYRNAFRDCRDRGMQWDQSTGKCSGG